MRPIPCLRLLTAMLFLLAANLLAAQRDTSKLDIEFGVHGGLSFPAENVEPDYDGSYFAEGVIGYHFNSLLSAEITGGVYHFQQSYHIYGANAYLRLSLGNWQTSPVVVSAAIGGGGYRPEELDGEWGVSGKATIDLRLSSQWILSAEGGYFKLQTTDQEWLTAGLGFKFHIW